MNLPAHSLNLSFADFPHAILGFGAGNPVPAGSGLALFLLGLITGVIAALAAFFVYLHISRARRALAHLDETGEEFVEDFEEPADPHSHPQQRMPWERPDDWWRRDP